ADGFFGHEDSLTRTLIAGRSGYAALAVTGDRLVGPRELAHDLHHTLVHAQVLGRPPAGNRQGVIGVDIHVLESRVQGEVVSGLFRVRLIAFEVVDRRLDPLAGLLARACGVHRMT